MKEQMQLFSWLLKLQGDQEPEAKGSKTREPRRFVPEVAVAYRGLRALILVKTGDHIEKFRLHARAMDQAAFSREAYMFAKTMVSIFVSDETFARRMAAERGYDKPVRAPLFVNTGKLYDLAISELDSELGP